MKSQSTMIALSFAALLTSLLLSPGSRGAAPEGLPAISIGSSACLLPDERSSQYAPIRGTGYFWLEHIYRGFPNGRELVALIESAKPVFPDRASVPANEYNCKDQKIVSLVWLPQARASEVLQLDCHQLTDQPLLPAEIVFGYADQSSPGLRKASRAWKATIRPNGLGGSIDPVDARTTVYCTVLPGIDSEAK